MLADADVVGPLVEHAARYEFTVRSFGPEYRGREVRGSLWLWPGSAADVSPRTGEHAASRADTHQPWIGATDLNLDAFRREGPADESRLRARVDPVYPPVLVQARASTSRSRAPTEIARLFIGNDNIRTGALILDGSGLQFVVMAQDSVMFRGTWGRSGIISRDSGEFCAIRAAP